MGTVVVICPVTCREISTGIETEAAILRGLPQIQAAVHCPECGEKHFWTCDDAMIAEAARKPNAL